MIGLAKPPIANPIVCNDNARARLRSNHDTVTAVNVRNPVAAIPNVVNIIVTTNSVRVSTWLIAMNPIATITAPTRMTRRVPKRVSAPPCAGPIRAPSVRVAANTNEKKVFDHPKRLRSSTARLP